MQDMKVTTSIASSAVNLFLKTVQLGGVPIAMLAAGITKLYPFWGQIRDIITVLEQCRKNAHRTGAQLSGGVSLEPIKDVWKKTRNVKRVLRTMNSLLGGHCIIQLAKHASRRPRRIMLVVKYIVETFVKPFDNLKKGVMVQDGIVDRFFVFVVWFANLIQANGGMNLQFLTFVASSIITVTTIGGLFEEIITLRNKLVLQQILAMPQPVETPFRDQTMQQKITSVRRCVAIRNRVDPAGILFPKTKNESLVSACIQGSVRPVLFWTSFFDSVNETVKAVAADLDVVFSEISNE